MKSSVAGVSLALVFSASLALAQAPPKPADEMKNLAFFSGSWTCEGSMPPSPGMPGGKTKTLVSSKSDLGGFWQSGTVKMTMPGSTAKGMEGMFHMTYDPGAKNYVMLWMDNMGGWAQSTSNGWDGDKIAFTGPGHMGGMTMNGRDTFVKNADGSMKHTCEMEMDGKWSPMCEETCRKAK